MIYYSIILSSKSLNSINNFFNILVNFTNFNFLAIKKTKLKKTKKNIITILKSPHVNKKAQEQFENRVFSKIFFISTTQDLKFLIILKKLKLELFPDIKINIKINIKNTKSFKIKIFDINNYNINFFNYKIKNCKVTKVKKQKKLLNFLKLLELYGKNAKK